MCALLCICYIKSTCYIIYIKSCNILAVIIKRLETSKMSHIILDISDLEVVEPIE